MFIPIEQAARQSLERLLDDIVEMAAILPEGETKRRLNEQIQRVEQLLLEHAA